MVGDFDINHDVPWLSKARFAHDTIAQALSQTHDTTAGAVITVDAHDTITLLGLTVAQLTAHLSDFHFFSERIIAVPMLKEGISAGAKHCAAKTPKPASSRYRWGIRHYEAQQFIAISAGPGTFPAIAGNEPSEIDD